MGDEEEESDGGGERGCCEVEMEEGEEEEVLLGEEGEDCGIDEGDRRGQEGVENTPGNPEILLSLRGD